MDLIFLKYWKVPVTLNASGILSRLRSSNGCDTFERCRVCWALLHCHADPKNPRPSWLAIGVKVWRKVLTIGLLCSARVLWSWCYWSSDRRRYRSAEITYKYYFNGKHSYVHFAKFNRRKIYEPFRVIRIDQLRRYSTPH